MIEDASGGVKLLRTIVPCSGLPGVNAWSNTGLVARSALLHLNSKAENGHRGEKGVKSDCVILAADPEEEEGDTCHYRRLRN
jgi:hypothetical protein